MSAEPSSQCVESLRVEPVPARRDLTYPAFGSQSSSLGHQKCPPMTSGTIRVQNNSNMLPALGLSHGSVVRGLAHFLALCSA
jgi:hypothetical protein